MREGMRQRLTDSAETALAVSSDGLTSSTASTWTLTTRIGDADSPKKRACPTTTRSPSTRSSRGRLFLQRTPRRVPGLRHRLGFRLIDPELVVLDELAEGGHLGPPTTAT